MGFPFKMADYADTANPLFPPQMVTILAKNFSFMKIPITDSTRKGFNKCSKNI